ncbi:MAG TPA: thiamine pyrophosphate-dependent enzyme [Bacteroidota bacterium]|jgi:pyruvate/2-oxoacid:ferredoxin oxidoreductase beta subunit|nr:thiamine pyrophosphate-dependent enzyme [Bacteroidota bacterium]
MPFCKGCGHAHVLRHLGEALGQLHLDPSKVCLVTDIGCIGLADSLFPAVHTVHTTHGRSTAFATGIELADAVLADSKLKIIVLIGDGGAMIGLLHLVNAALLNVDVTVLLCNNFLFGMTGGQNSAFSPLDFVTATSPKGNIVPPLDICNVMVDAHARFVVRSLATDKNLTSTIAQAVSFEGFSLVEIVELCTEYGTKKNQLSGNQLRSIAERHGQRFGELHGTNDRPEFASLYSGKFPPVQSVHPPGRSNGNEDSLDNFLTPTCSSSLDRKKGIIVAGSAGERVQSTAHLFCQAAVRAALYSTQKNDNPVTQGTGFSFSEICISPREIWYTGIERADAVIIVSEDGLRETSAKGIFPKLTPEAIVIADSELKIPETRARVLQLPFRSTCGAVKAAAAGLSAYLTLTDDFPVSAFHEALNGKTGAGKTFFAESFHLMLDSLCPASFANAGR